MWRASPRLRCPSGYPDADAAFIAGSIIRGEGTRLSDVDLVVLYGSLPNARRESFECEGLPVEAFVHDGQTLSYFLESDVKRGYAAILGMVAEGVIIGARTREALAWQRLARPWLERGPGPLDPSTIDDLRYDITDKVDDLLGERTRGEIIAIGAALYRPLAELALRRRGSWAATGKWIPRLLGRVDSEVAVRFQHAFQTLSEAADSREVLALADVELAAVGGRLFAGYVRQAAADKRMPQSLIP